MRTGSELENITSKIPKRDYDKYSVTLFGDSFTYYQETDDNQTLASSCWAFILASLGKNVVNLTNAGVGGNTSSHMRSRFTEDVWKKSSDYVFGQCGVNDFYGYDMEVEDVLDNVTYMISKLLNTNRKVIWLNCPPQNINRSLFSVEKSQKVVDFNKKLAEWAVNRENCYVVDVYSYLCDWSNANGVARDFVISKDYIHLSTYGSYMYYKAFDDQVGYLFPSRKTLALENPMETSYLPNGCFQGNQGTLGSNTTGARPDDWNISTGNGATTEVASTEEGLLLTVSCTDANSARLRLQSYNYQGTVPQDSTLSMETTLSLDIEDCQLIEARNYLYSVGSEGYSTRDWGRVKNGYIGSKNITTKDLLIKTIPYKVEKNHTEIRTYLDFTFNGTGTAKILLKSCKVVDS